MAWLTGWTYRKEVTLSRASGTVSDYQMKLLVGESAGATGEDVDCNSHCQTDFDDLRFTTSDGTTLLDYWIESITGATPNQLATVWIEFDSIGTGATTFYMYYGKADAISGSHGKQTFLLFDDFLDGVNPVLKPTQGWESGLQLRWGTIALLTGTYYIYYTNGTDLTSDIGRATSTDLKTWTKAAGNPIITNVVGPALLKGLDGVTPLTDAGNYYMTTCLADGSKIQIRSDNAINGGTWGVAADSVIIPTASTWYSSQVLTNCFIKSGDTFYIFFQGYDGTYWKIGYATASSVTGPYTVQGILLSSSEGWESNYVLDPEVRLFDGTYYLFYTGNAGTNCRISYATASALTGPYTKSGIFLSDTGHSYSAILQKDGLYWILGDNLNASGQKDLSSREDLNGLFNFEPYLITEPSGGWDIGQTPTLSGGELVINAADEYVKSASAKGLDTALRARAKFPTYADWLQIGYNNDTGAATSNQASFFIYSTPTVKAISSVGGGNTITDLGDKGADYHIWEIKRTSTTPKNVYLIDDNIVVTHTTSIVLDARTTLIEDSVGAGLINVDWILVRQILETEPAWGGWGNEEANTQTMEMTASGGALLGGVVLSCRAVAIGTQHGALVGGGSLFNRTRSFLSGGGALSGGSVALARTLSLVAEAGAIVGGDSPLSFTHILTISMNGGALAGGIAHLVRGRSILASGGALAGGIAHLVRGRGILASGGALLGGLALCQIISVIPPTSIVYFYPKWFESEEVAWPQDDDDTYRFPIW